MISYKFREFIFEIQNNFEEKCRNKAKTNKYLRDILNIESFRKYLKNIVKLSWNLVFHNMTSRIVYYISDDTSKLVPQNKGPIDFVKDKETTNEVSKYEQGRKYYILWPLLYREPNKEYLHGTVLKM